MKGWDSTRSEKNESPYSATQLTACPNQILAPEVEKSVIYPATIFFSPATTIEFGPQLETFLQICYFTSAWVIANHFLTTFPTIREIHQRQLWVKRFSRFWVPN
jgi:hypothetical protein